MHTEGNMRSSHSVKCEFDARIPVTAVSLTGSSVSSKKRSQFVTIQV